MNNGTIYRGMIDAEGGITGGITGTEICNRAVQKAALRLHSGEIAGRTKAETKGIRALHRQVYVWPDPSGNPGAAGKGRECYGRCLMVCFCGYYFLEGGRY